MRSYIWNWQTYKRQADITLLFQYILFYIFHFLLCTCIIVESLPISDINLVVHMNHFPVILHCDTGLQGHYSRHYRTIKIAFKVDHQ